jgi:hypothetical protein
MYLFYIYKQELIITKIDSENHEKNYQYPFVANNSRVKP